MTCVCVCWTGMNSALPRSAVLAPDGKERMLPVCYLIACTLTHAAWA